MVSAARRRLAQSPGFAFGHQALTAEHDNLTFEEFFAGPYRGVGSSGDLHVVTRRPAPVVYSSDRFLANITGIDAQGNIQVDSARSGLAAVTGQLAEGLSTQTRFVWVVNPRTPLEFANMGRRLHYGHIEVVLTPTTPEQHAKARGFTGEKPWMSAHELGELVPPMDDPGWSPEYRSLIRLAMRKARAVNMFSPTRTAPVLAQDPHEIGLGAALRLIGYPGASSLYFHTPVGTSPQYENWPPDILRAWLHASRSFDAVGFQTKKFRERYMRLLQNNGVPFPANMYVSPVAVGTENSHALSHNPIADAVAAELTEFKGVDKNGRPRDLIVFVGRNDPSKGAVALNIYLVALAKKYPELVDRFRLAYVGESTRAGDAYEENGRNINRTMNWLTSQFGEQMVWDKRTHPLYKDNADFEVVAGIQRVANAIVLNALVEGQGIVYEETLPENECDVIGLMTTDIGAYEKFEGACIPLPPIKGTVPTREEVEIGVEAIRRFLLMTPEQRKAMNAEANLRVENHSPLDWHLDQFSAAVVGRERQSPLTAPELSCVLSGYANGPSLEFGSSFLL